MVGKSAYCFEVSSDIDQTSFGWTAGKFYKGKDVFSCSQEAEWKPPSLLEKFHCKAEGSPDAVGQRLPWSVSHSGTKRRLGTAAEQHLKIGGVFWFSWIVMVLMGLLI